MTHAIEQVTGQMSAESTWAVSAHPISYPGNAAYNPEPGDRVYTCVVQIADEDGDVAIAMTFCGESPRQMIEHDMARTRIVLTDWYSDDRKIEFDPAPIAAKALEHFWWVTFGVRYGAGELPEIRQRHEALLGRVGSNPPFDPER